MTLNNTRVIWTPYICVTSIHKSHITLRFTLRPIIFKIQAILRQMHQMTPNWLWPIQVKWSYICTKTVPESQISLSFTLRPSVFKLHTIFRQVHQMTPKWHICVKDVPESQISLFCSMTSRFQVDIAHFIIPIDYHVNAPPNKKDKNKFPKIQNLKFHNSLNNFGRDPPYKYAWFCNWGNESDVYFQRRCRLNFFLPYGPIFMKTKKDRKKSKI